MPAEAWSDLGWELVRAVDADEVCRRVSRWVVEELPFSRSLVALLEGGSDRLVGRAGHDPAVSEAVVQALVSLVEFPVEADPDGSVPASVRCLLEGQQIHVPDVREEPDLPDGTHVDSFKARALRVDDVLLTPLTSPEGPLGIVAVDKKRREEPITADERRWMRRVGALAGGALHARRSEEAVETGVREGERGQARPGRAARDGGFLPMLVHDLRSPAESVVGFAELLRMGQVGPLNEDQEEFVARIERCGERMLSLTRDLLALRAPDPKDALVERRPVAADRIMVEVAEDLHPQARRASVEVRTEVSDELPPVDADPRRLVQLFQNLAENAIQVSVPGDVVRIRGRADGRDGGGRVRFDIEDEGPGLESEEARRMFQLRRGAPNGSGGSRRGGLGLVVSRFVVEAHGGSIWAEPSPGGGLRVSFTLPSAARDRSRTGRTRQ